MKKFILILLLFCNLTAFPSYNVDTLNRIDSVTIEV